MQVNPNPGAPLYHREPLRAEGNLTYLEFIALVRKWWEEDHPEIPIVPTQGQNFAKYPSIVYALESRITAENERKPRLRDQVVDETGKMFLIHGQRYRNSVSFTVVTESDPFLCETIIEAFEDWMLEYTWMFKQTGASEFSYQRRMPDSEETRSGEDICKRSVVYDLWTEKILKTPVERINEIVIDMRTFLEDNNFIDINDYESATPVSTNIYDQYGSATPSS